MASYKIDFATVLRATAPLWDAVGPDFAARVAGAPEPADEVPSNVVPLHGGSEPIISHVPLWSTVAERLKAQDAKLYNAWFARLEAIEIDVEARVAQLEPVETYEAMVRERFGELADAVVGHMRKLYPTPEVLRQRLTFLKDNWASIIEDVNGSLKPAAAIRDELADAGCPVTFAQIGVTDERARRATAWCKDIRGRYTILHLAFELGVLDAWTDEVLEAFHGIKA